MVKLISGWDFPSSLRGLSLLSGIWARHPRDTLQCLPWLVVLLALLLRAGGEHTQCRTHIHLGCCCCSVAKSCPTICPPWTAAPGSSLLHCLPEFAQIHVHWVGDTILPFHCLPLPSLFCPQSFPASGSFPMSWHFASGGQNNGASASVVLMNILWVPVPNLPSTSWVTVDGSSALSEPQKKGLAAS